MAKKTNTNATPATTETTTNTVVDTVKFERLTKISNEIISLQKSSEGIAEKIAGYLAIIKVDKLYEQDGSKSFGEYAVSHFGISKGTASDSANTFIRFGAFDKENDTFSIKSEYSDYAFSALMQMKGLTDEGIEILGINPAMSRDAIKVTIKNHKAIADTKTRREELGEEIDRTTNALKAHLGEYQTQEVVKEVIPDYYVEGRNPSVEELEALNTALADKLDGCEDLAMEQAYQEKIDADIAAMENGEDLSPEMPTKTINLARYHNLDGTLVKDRLLKEIWKMLQEVDKNEYDLVITNTKLV